MKRLGIIDIWREAAELDHNHILLEEIRGGRGTITVCRIKEFKFLHFS